MTDSQHGFNWLFLIKLLIETVCMTDKCSVNCKENADSVDKINWKCVECGTNLQSIIEKLFEKREKDYSESKRVAAENDIDQLTEKQKQHRRSMTIK